MARITADWTPSRGQNFGSRDIPIFTVGIGQEQIPQDIGIVDVNTAKTVLEGLSSMSQSGSIMRVIRASRSGYLFSMMIRKWHQKW